MQVIRDSYTLTQAIAKLENIQKSEANLLKEHFKFTLDSINPVNIIKEKFFSIVSSPTLRNQFVQGAIGIATGLLSSKLIIGTSGGIFKKIIAGLVQTGITKVMVKDPQTLKASGIEFLKDTLTKMKVKEV